MPLRGSRQGRGDHKTERLRLRLRLRLRQRQRQLRRDASQQSTASAARTGGPPFQCCWQLLVDALIVPVTLRA